MKDKLLFVHIPKTGGTSVVQSFNDATQYNNKFAIPPFPKRNSQFPLIKHVTLVEYSDYNKLEDFFKFTVVRNPYTRVYSYYKQYQKMNGYFKPLEEFLKLINDKKCLVEEKANQRLGKLLSEEPNFVRSLHVIDEDAIKQVFNEYVKKSKEVYFIRQNGSRGKSIIPDTTPFIFPTQSYYIKNKFGQLQVDKVYKTENMQELETDFNIKMAMVNVNAGDYTKEDYYKDYNTIAIDMVKDIYSEDFTNFGYSTDFT